MSNYLNENARPANVYENPIKPKDDEWTVLENKITRSYSFEDKKFLEAFIVEIIKYNRESDVDLEFRIRQNKVGIIIHSLYFQVTDLEIKAKKDIEKIKRDVMYYYAK